MSNSFFLPLKGTIPGVCMCRMEVSLSELDCPEDLLAPSQDLSWQGGRKVWGPWVLVWWCVCRGCSGKPHHQHAVPFSRGDTWGGGETDCWWSLRTEMQNWTHLRSRSCGRDARGRVIQAELLPGKFLLECFKTSRRMSICHAARYRVSDCVPIDRRYVQGYI